MCVCVSCYHPGYLLQQLLFQRCDLNTRPPERQHSSRLEWLTPSTTWCPTTRGAFFVPNVSKIRKSQKLKYCLPVFLAKSSGSYFQVIHPFQNTGGSIRKFQLWSPHLAQNASGDWTWNDRNMLPRTHKGCMSQIPFAIKKAQGLALHVLSCGKWFGTSANS